jgi:phenylalanine-4-hydroxylase
MDPNGKVPGHLRRYIVRQDYAQYTEEDQAVWRFVVLQTHARLTDTAHEAYLRGFAAAGISVDRIPRIDEMNERLGRFGWGAVCVDGFIPPRAFQAFQALGILPIAADIRTSKHLTYTPAPDIIHEAAGHAPFLAEPRYARYIRRIGEVGRHAFGTPADRAVYDAIYALSEIKEDPASNPLQVRRAEAALAEATAQTTTSSESARVARLYWWTAEYGLVGTPADHKLYGAGLLSSIGEGYFCRLPAVRKIPLTKECVDFDYDVTRAQPQLFVAKSFAHLEEVLDDVDRTLSYRIGGRPALQMAESSRELGTVALDSGTEVIGVVDRVEEHEGRPALIELTGPCALSRAGALLDVMPRRSGYLLPLGTLTDGTSLSALSPDALSSRAGTDGRLVLTLSSGVRIEGTPRAMVVDDGRVCAALLADFRLVRGDEIRLRAELYPLAFGEQVRTAWPGAPDAFFPETPASGVTVPKPRTFSEADVERIALHERAVHAFREAGGTHAGDEVAAILARLEAAFPDEWLLRWNLLEGIVKRGEEPDLAKRLVKELELLEVRFDRQEPIATGLEYIRRLLGPTNADSRAFAG